MAGWRAGAVSLLGILLSASLVHPGTPPASLAASEHCADMPSHASGAMPHGAPPGPACHQSNPCSDCGATPCRAAAHCAGPTVLAVTSVASRRALDFGLGDRPAPRSARIVTRTTSPPTPPPIALL